MFLTYWRMASSPCANAVQKVVLDEYQLFGLPIFNPHPFSSPPEEGRNDRAIKYRFRCRPWLVRGRETTCERNNPRRLLQLTPGILAMRFCPRRDAGASNTHLLPASRRADSFVSLASARTPQRTVFILHVAKFG